MVAPPQSAFPERRSQSNPRRSCILSRSLTSVQESSDIGLQGKQQAEEKNGMFVSRPRATASAFGVKPYIFSLTPFCFFLVMPGQPSLGALSRRFGPLQVPLAHPALGSAGQIGKYCR